MTAPATEIAAGAAVPGGASTDVTSSSHVGTCAAGDKPAASFPARKYPFDTMQVGESFWVSSIYGNTQSAVTSANQAKRRTGRVFKSKTTQPTGEIERGVTITRVA